MHKEKTEASVITVEEEEVPWYYDIMNFLEIGAHLDGVDKRKCHSIRTLATQYILCGGKLYRRSYDGVHLHYLKKEAAEKVMEEVHKGICGPHMNG